MQVSTALRNSQLDDGVLLLLGVCDYVGSFKTPLFPA